MFQATYVEREASKARCLKILRYGARGPCKFLIQLDVYAWPVVYRING